MNIDTRRYVWPPLLALVLSLAAHLAFVRGTPLDWRTEPDRALDTVIIEYRPDNREGTAPAPQAPAREEPPAPRQARAAAPDKAGTAVPQPAPAARPAPTPQAEPPPQAAAPPAPQPRPVESPPAPPSPPDRASVPVPETAPPEPRRLPLDSLLPTREELKTFTSSGGLPDPAGGATEAVTLRLGETDIRYRGYLEAVKGAIDVSQNWKEAVLAAGGGGTVVVRMTLSSGGALAAAAVERSSGKPLLDKAALDAVERAPLPAFPEHWTISALNLYAQFEYSLVAF